MLLFTTGRGSVFGSRPVPSIEIATNTLMHEHMLDMDLDAGVVLDGTPVGGSGPPSARWSLRPGV
jgi:altronate hydrolase